MSFLVRTNNSHSMHKISSFIIEVNPFLLILKKKFIDIIIYIKSIQEARQPHVMNTTTTITIKYQNHQIHDYY